MIKQTNILTKYSDDKYGDIGYIEANKGKTTEIHVYKISSEEELELAIKFLNKIKGTKWYE